MSTLQMADEAAEALGDALDQFEWLNSIAVERDARRGYVVSVRIDPSVPLELARAQGRIPPETHGVSVHVRHEGEARAFSA
jgi:hypothetical protein